MKKQLVMFGGTFDPITKAHFNLAKTVLNLKEINPDKILFVPTGDTYNKKGKSPAKTRVEILKETLKNEPNMDIDLTEVQCDRKLYSFETLELLSKKI